MKIQKIYTSSFAVFLSFMVSTLTFADNIEIYTNDHKNQADGCETNNTSSTDTVFEFRDVRLPVLNINSRDNGNSGEAFGSPLLSNPAWLR